MIELIPAIDIIGGKCVRLSQGDYSSKKVYNDDPLEVAKELEAHGIRRLHVVDLDGAASRHVVNYHTLQRIASGTSLVIDFGGGVKTDEDLKIAFENGAQMVTGGSVAVTDPELFSHWLAAYGPERIILGADVKDEKVAVNGWKEESAWKLFPFWKTTMPGGHESDMYRHRLRRHVAGPVGRVVQEDIGPFPDLHLIASGGVGSMADVDALEAAKVPAVIFGKALYEGRITLKEIERKLA